MTVESSPVESKGFALFHIKKLSRTGELLGKGVYHNFLKYFLHNYFILKTLTISIRRV